MTLRVGELRPNQLLHTYGIGAMADLFAQVRGNRVRVDCEHPMQKIGPRVQQAARPREVDAAAAVDHVAGESEWASGEAEQRYVAVERALDLGHRGEDVS